ncbi:hypothetical protein P7H22_04790 [Paenibacillus larvae]|nr:hypothetical protein [Paenibacillus larvae]MDT2239822.1 hypothetical protein [Paenibacillus larvae]
MKCSVDTARIDPVVLIQKKGEKATIFDEGGEGADEQTPLLNVMEGIITSGFPTPRNRIIL